MKSRFLAAGRRLRAVYARPAASVAVAALVVVASVLSGSVEGTDRTFVQMGFDPDRAQLITALVIGGCAGAAAALVRSRALAASLLGTVGFFALYTQTFAAETRNALAATGADGAFDAMGWVLTLLTLAVTGGIAAWIGVTLAIALRPGVIATGASVARIGRWALSVARVRRLAAAPPRPDRRSLQRPLAALVVVILLAVCVPVFSDMVNLSPDALMLNGVAHEPLVPDEPTPGEDASPAATADSAPSAAATVEPAGSKPWLAWRPAGAGTVTLVNMPAPWKGGLSNVSEINIYTPAGYEPAGSRLYPVVYEAPTGLPLWGKGTGVISALDTMIRSGDMPASIVVFIDSANSPNTDSQCADAYDGAQWFETYISQTVPAYIDSHYKTIRDPRARAVMGQSAGGYCAAMLATRHPDVFGTSISYSGYFVAGAVGANAKRPFGTQANLDSHSPILLLPKIPVATRAGMYFIVVANSHQNPYGLEAEQFDKALTANGYEFLAINSPFPHGWPEVRYETPAALKAWAARMVKLGVW